MKAIVICLLLASVSTRFCLAEVRESVTLDGATVTVRADGGAARISVVRTDEGAVVKVVDACERKLWVETK